MYKQKKLEANWHLELICEYLQCVADGRIRKLLVNVPPRSLKSFICSICFPAWVWGRDPAEQFIVGSYSEQLAFQHSVLCRNLVESDWYLQWFRGPRLAPGQNEKRKYSTVERGHRIAAAVGGTVVGEGCNILIVDDPHNPKQALSAAERERACVVWHDHSLSTRFNDHRTGREIIVMQRLHVDDLTGHVLAREDDWVHLKIPTRAKKREVWKFPLSGRVVEREAGQLLHPARFGEAEDESAKRRLGPYGYAAQHEQEPVPLGGAVIQLAWFPRWRELPDRHVRAVISVDTGVKPGKGHNPTCISVFVYDGRVWYLADVLMREIDFIAMIETIVGMADKWHCNDLIVLVEDKASGSAVIQTLKSKTLLRVVAAQPRGPKEQRVEEGMAQLSSGIISLPNDPVKVPWLNEIERHLISYPNPPAWDFLDTLSQFLHLLRNGCTARPRVFAL